MHVIILFQHWIHECHNQITKLLNMGGWIKAKLDIM